MSLVLTLALLAPAGPVRPVGIAWYETAQVDARTKIRLAEGISQELGVPAGELVLDAVGEARRRRAYALDQRDAQNLSDLQARLDLAVARFQAGDMVQAGDDAGVLLERLRDVAVLPGVPRLAWQVHILLARIHWTAGESEQADVELRRAASLDPEATLSTRRAPPDFAAAYEVQRVGLQATRDTWAMFALPEGTLRGAQIEIDGQLGNRPVAPGEHYLIVRWPGAAAVGAVASTDEPPKLPPHKTEVPGDLPVDRPSAQRICDALALDRLVLARRRDDRLGVQVFSCGTGFASAWYSTETTDDEATWQTLADAAPLRVSGRSARGRSQLLDRAPWPRKPVEQVATTDGPPPDRPVDTVKKPWFRRVWVWVVIGGVVAAGVTTGAVLGTRPDTTTVVVDGGEFVQ